MSDTEASWQYIILYTFIAYLFIHLLCEDILLIIKYCRIRSNVSNLTVESQEQRTVVTIFIKICDIVSRSVDGYFTTFTACWTKSLECLETIMCAYFKLLEFLIEKLLLWPTNLIMGIASVIIVGFIVTSFYVIKN